MQIHRKKGQKIPPGMMPDITALRALRPDMFKDVVVIQQPSATVDEVIIGWGMEDLMTRFPQFVVLRDLVSGALSNNAKLGAKIAQTIACWIGPQMAPVCQLTDTDIAFVLKSFLRRSKGRLILQMKQRASHSGSYAHVRCSLFEIMTMVAESHQDLATRNEDTQLIVKGLRCNGCFACCVDCRSNGICDRRADLEARSDDASAECARRMAVS